MRVAVTPADSSAGINVLRSLRLATGVHVIGLLRRRHAVAERFSDATVLASLPAARLAWIRDACAADAVDAVLVAHSGDVEGLASVAEFDRAVRSRTLLPAGDVIRVCADKLMMSELLSRWRLPMIPTRRLRDVTSSRELPVFAKARFGTGGLGGRLITDVQGLRAARDESIELVVQPVMSGAEVSVDYLADQHAVLCFSPRARIAVNGGRTIVGQTLSGEPFAPILRTVTAALGLRGPGNIQFFMTNLGPIISDINLRFAAGGLMLTTAAGLNLPMLTIRRIMQLPTRIPRPVEGVVMYRYETEIFARR